jgi:alpha-glucosidase
MPRVPIPSDQVHDIFEKLVPGYGINRDPERSPMRWDGGPNGGFTSGEPWLTMGPEIADRNVRKFREDSKSLLWLYRRLIELRRREPVLTAGAHKPLRSRNDLLLFERASDSERVLIGLNIASEPRKLDLAREGELLLSTHLDRTGPVEQSLVLRADEGVVIKYAKS